MVDSQPQGDTFARSLLESAPDAMIVVDDDHIIVLANSQAEKLFGHERSAMIGRSLDLLIPHRFRDTHQDHSRRFAQHPVSRPMGTSGIELFALHKDGSEIPVHISLSPVRDGDKKLVIAAVRDATAQKAAERDLRRAIAMAEAASNAKGRFLANISHEIRTPMNAILGMSELLLDTSLSETQRDHLDILRKSAESLLVLLNDVLDYSRIEQDRMELERAEFSIRDVVRLASDSFRLEARAKDLSLTTHFDGNVPRRVVGDPNRLRQVLVNLISNAVKFTTQGGVAVRVRSEQSGRECKLLIEVEDSGTGIPPEQRAHVFDAFQQADSSIARKFGGTGLGLAITSKLIAMMGGSIQFESEVGRGTKFVATAPFPIASSDAETPAQEQAAPAGQPVAPREGLRILVAEDQSYNQTLIKALLEKRNHQPTIVENGRLAVEAFREGTFDLVLMDVRMPEMDGLEATRQIRRHEKERRVPIVAMTAEAMHGDCEACLAAGMDRYLAKPIRVHELFATIDELCPQPAAGPGQHRVGPIETRRTELVERVAKRADGGNFDWSAALANVNGRFELLARIVDAFLDDYPQTKQSLTDAAAEAQAESLHLVSHGLKGAMQTLGADHAGRLAQAIELSARAGDMTEMESKVHSLIDEINQLLPVFRSFVDDARRQRPAD